MLARTMILSCAIIFAMIIAMPVHAQVKLEDLHFQNKTIEPGAGLDMVTGTQTGSAALGDGVIVFKFKVTDIDPIADDTSNVAITCILIQNLGTATGGTDASNSADIVQVMVLDQDSNAVPAVNGNPAEPGAAAATNPSTLSGCNSMATTSANAQIAWERFFNLSAPFVIPDDGTEEFQVAVRTDTTDVLTDDSQNHTLVLRATLQIQETVGSPPAATTFVDPVTDSAPEVIWNGGINRFTEDTWVVNPLMPGETGVVSRFTICDDDADEDQLILDRFFIRQDEFGTALSSDIVSLDLYRVEGFTRTLVASRTPDATFERGSGTTEQLAFPGGGFTFITIPDDTCMTFELEAQISPFAFKGHSISPRIKVSAREPSTTTLIDPSVDPEVRTNFPTLIGKGLLILPDTKLTGKPGIIPLNVAGVQLPGFGTLQVGPNGKLQYDPRVINIKSIRGIGPYIVDAVEIDNRRGEARFTVRIDPNFDADGDGDPDNTLLTGFQDGTIANIFIEPIGDPGDRTRLVLTFDCFELVDQMNCIPVGFPNPSVPNQNPNNDISVSAGEVTLLYPGDLDFDGAPTIRDALKLANAILPCALSSSTQTDSVQFEITEEQRSVSDVVAPFADSDEIPGCAELTSADVAEIARLAINFGTTPAPSAAVASISTPQGNRPWYSFLVDAWNWLTGTQSGLDLAQLDMNFNTTSQSLDIAVIDVPGAAAAGIQGRVYFDPSAMQINSVSGINGYNVLAANVDNSLGEVRFIALAPKGQGIYDGNVLRLNVNASSQTFSPTLTVDAFVDEDALDIPFAMAGERGFAASPIALSLSGVQALSQGNGTYQFYAQGAGIAGIQVQVYDLAGGKLFDQETAGNTLMFQAMTRAGQPFANGVYLYVITAKGFQGQTLRSEVNKLAILR